MINTIFYGVFSAFWYVFCYFPLMLLKLVINLLDLLAIKIPMFVLFGGQEFKWGSQTIIYYFLFAVLAIFIIFGIVFVKFILSFKNAERRFEFKMSFKYSIVACLMIVAMPVVIYGLHLFMILLYETTQQIFGKSQENNITAEIVRQLMPKFKDTLTSQGSQKWYTQVSQNFKINKELWITFAEGSSSLLIIETFISATSTLYVLFGLFVGVSKSTFNQFGLFTTLPTTIALGAKDGGQSLRKWIADYIKILLKTLILLVLLIVFRLYIEIANKSSIALTNFLFNQDNTLNYLIKPLISITLIVGGALGYKSLINKILNQFNLEEFASKKSTKLKGKENVEIKSNLIPKTNGISSSKNVLPSNNYQNNRLIQNKNNISQKQKLNNNNKTLFLPVVSKLKNKISN